MGRVVDVPIQPWIRQPQELNAVDGFALIRVSCAINGNRSSSPLLGRAKRVLYHAT